MVAALSYCIYALLNLQEEVEVAFQELIRGKGIQFDPEIADVFMKVYGGIFKTHWGE